MAEAKVGKYFWKTEELPVVEGEIFIDEILLSPFNINLTFKNQGSSPDMDVLVVFKAFI